MPVDLLDKEVKLSLYLERYRPVFMSETAKALSEALFNIEQKLAKTEDMVQRTRLKQIERHIVDELNNAYKPMQKWVVRDMADIGDLSYSMLIDAMTSHGAKYISFAALPKAAIDRIMDLDAVLKLDEKGYTIAGMMGLQRDSHINRFKQIVAAGLAEGVSSDTIARRLREVNDRVSRVDLEAIARTVTSEARGRAAVEAYKQADDVIIGWQSVGVLDNRTSKRCAALDGTIWYKSQGWTIEKLIKLNYWYPRHFRCRTVVVPRTKMSAELDLQRTRASNARYERRVPILTQDGRQATGSDGAPLTRIVTIDGPVGQVPAKTKFQDFFDVQNEQFKLDYLGSARYQLYRHNRLEIKDFVDIKTGREYSISEIRERFGIKPTPIKPEPKPQDKPHKVEPSPIAVRMANVRQRFSKFGDKIGESMARITSKIHPSAQKMIDDTPLPAMIKESGGYYSHSQGLICMDRTKDSIWMHEYGHYLDYVVGDKYGELYGKGLSISKTMGYSKTLRAAFDADAKLYSGRSKAGKENLGKFFAYYDDMVAKSDRTKAIHTVGGLSDIISSFTKGKSYSMGYPGHNPKYYRGNYGVENREAMANLFELYANMTYWDDVKRFAPNLAEAFEAYVDHFINGNLDQF